MPWRPRRRYRAVMDPADIMRIVVIAAIVVIDVVALIVIPRGRKPTAAMAWLLLILAVPVVGILLYLLIGNARLPVRRRDEQALVDEVIRARAHGSTAARPP